MTGHNPHQNTDPKQEPSLRDMIEATKEGLNNDKNWLHRAEHERVARNAQANYERDRAGHDFINKGGLHIGTISVEKEIMLKSVAPWIAIGIIIICVACIASGLGGSILRTVFPPPTPTAQYLENPNMPGTYIQVFPATVVSATENPIQVVEEQSTPVPLNLQPVPTPASGQYFAVQVVHNKVYGKASPWAPLSAGSESYYSMITVATCGSSIALPLDYDIYALVDTNQPVYGPEIIAGQNGVTITCDGYNSNIVFAVMNKP